MIQQMQMDCPPGWLDKSMLILSGSQPGASGVTANMVVTRDRMPQDLPSTPDARMRALLERQAEQMREQLAGFAEVGRSIRLDGGDPTAQIKVDWSSPQAQLTQSITFVDAGHDGLIVATATAGRGEFADAEPLFREMLRSFRISS